MAKAYANLLKEMYTGGSSSSFSPRSFKATVGRHAAAFSGYGQQDSQEFLLFLLDGLQEDLNRIYKKPYIEKPDSTDEMVHDQKALQGLADKCWEIYKARNDSVITDLFAGMYKSTLVCPKCEKVSIIFDPFNNLTLQLPVENLWSKNIFVFPLHERPIRVAVDINQNATFLELKEYVAKKINSDARRLIVLEIYKHKFFKIYNDSTTLAEERIALGDVMAMYEVDEVPTNYPLPKKQGYRVRSLLSAGSDEEDGVPAEGDESPMADRMVVTVFNRKPTETSSRFHSKELFAQPFFIVLDRNEVRDPEQILRKILVKVQTMTTTDLNEDGASDVEDSDGVIMNADDADSSTDSKVQAASIESEDGMVDVSMRDPGEEETPTTAPRISYPPQSQTARPKYRLSTMLQRGDPIPEKVRKLFDISIMHTKKLIPAGWEHPSDESKKYPLFSERVRKRDQKLQRTRRARQRGAAADATSAAQGAAAKLKRRIANGGSGSDSESEVDDPPPARRSSASGYPSGNASSAEDDDQMGKPAFSAFSRTTTRSASGLISGARTGQSRTSSADDTPQQSSPDTTPADDRSSPGDDSEEPPPPLLSLGEALVLEWDLPTHDALFSVARRHGADELRGAPTWEDCPLLPDPALEGARRERAARKKDGVSLADCLDEFERPEVLSENDAWYCPRCKEHRRASKTFELWKAPDILVVHLKRFSAQGRLRDKLDVRVDFPIEGLDLTERVAVHEGGKDLVYDLVAVDNHYGGLGGGHYTAFARNFVDGNWYEYNGMFSYLDFLIAILTFMQMPKSCAVRIPRASSPPPPTSSSIAAAPLTTPHSAAQPSRISSAPPATPTCSTPTKPTRRRGKAGASTIPPAMVRRALRPQPQPFTQREVVDAPQPRAQRERPRITAASSLTKPLGSRGARGSVRSRMTPTTPRPSTCTPQPTTTPTMTTTRSCRATRRAIHAASPTTTPTPRPTTAWTRTTTPGATIPS